MDDVFMDEIESNGHDFDINCPSCGDDDVYIISYNETEDNILMLCSNCKHKFFMENK